MMDERITIENSKALSPDIKELFITIRSQAEEFTGALEFFRIHHKDSEKLNLELTALAEDIRNRSNDILTNSNQSISDAIAKLELKNEKILEIYKEIESIISLKKSLTSLFESVRKQSAEIQSGITDFKQKTDKDVESIINNISSRFEKDLEIRFRRIETRYSLRLKNIETILEMIEQKIYKQNEALELQNKKLLKENSSLVTQINNIKDSIDDMILSSEKAISDLELRLKNNIDGINFVISDFDAPSKMIKIKKNDSDQTNISLSKIPNDEELQEEQPYQPDDILTLKNNVSKMLQIQDKLRKNLTLAIIMAIVAIAGCGAMLLVNFLK
jgi:hypothetical protein